MSIHNWLHYFRSELTPGKRPRKTGRRDAQRFMPYRLQVESLEDRRMLSFVPAANYPTAPATPSAIVTADFNNDGNLDLATCANAVTGSFSVLLGDGAGGFGAAQRTILASDLSAIAAADFNNDGRADLVVSDTIGFYVLTGNGDGTFQPASARHAFGMGMSAVRDFNGDDNDDVLVSWIDGDWATHFQVYRGNGQGGFMAGYDVYYWGLGATAAVDLNNDDLLDVATAEGVAFLGNVYGSFDFDWEQQAPLGGGAIAAGDFTGEGNADVIVAGDGVAVLRGNGDGTFAAPLRHSFGRGYDTAVATGDFNADGRLDAVVTNADLGSASVMLGNGDGTLRFFGAFATGTSPSGVVVGDFNRDGRPDVAASNAVSQTVSVLLNDGDWTTPQPPPPPPPPSITIEDRTLTEGNTGLQQASFIATLSAASTAMVTVAYATGDGYANAGSDYQAASGTLTFAPGETSKTVTVLVNGDRLSEPNETFVVNLSSPTNATLADGQGVGTIVDDEPRISISDVSKKEGRRNQTTLFTFTVTLSAAYDQPVTMSYRTVNGTATTSNSDYVAKTGTLTFAPGQTTKTITIEVKGDSKREAGETFYLDLFANSSNSSFAKSRGIGTILNDD